MDELHVKYRLKKLWDRRKMFMLKMIYKLSMKEEHFNTYRPEVVLRTAPKVKMKVDFTDKDRVRRSPYYRCNILWDNLNSKMQRSINMFEFAKGLYCLDLSEL